MRFTRKLFILLGLALACQYTMAAGRASHVVLVVWDGMRPDFVTPETAPALSQLAKDGVTFLHHHPVYLSLTEVNGTALATGVYPGQSGILGNNDYRPAIDPDKPIESDSLAAIRKGDLVLPQHFIACPTVAEILHAATMRTAITGSKPVALLHDRAPRPDEDPNANVFAGETLPANLKDKLDEALGNFPAPEGNKIKIDQWTTAALTGQLWKDGVPAYSLLWMAEPDYSQHKYAPGSPEALKAIKNNDSDLARLLQVLKEKNAFDSTDVIIVSDHGFSTVFEAVDVAATLNEHGIHAYRKAPDNGLSDGDTIVVGNAGAAFCYVKNQNKQVIEQAVHALQAQSYAGVIFSRIPVEGAFPLSAAHLDAPAAPDVVVVMRWKPDLNQFGAPGLICSDSHTYSPGHGTHGTLSMTDMHNIGFAAGPDFARGMIDSLPTGNIDIAPTILWLLNVAPKEKMSGRVLTEALTVAGPPVESFEPHHEEASFKGDGFTWRQYLDWSSVNGVCYLDQGNGRQEK
ncbi:MAG TPA: alkaline phosphatase family protein [Verrucomicrobiae bacterium]|jgi:arylsulfatase A-like enzyme